MISHILEKLLFKNQPVSEEERAQLLDWFTRAESANTVNTVEEALKSRQWVNNLSEISNKTGLQIAGEFRTGNGKTPGDGFTGGRFGWPGFSYGGTDYFLAGVSNDALQVGMALASGKIIAGGGDVVIDEFGVSFQNQEGNLTFEDTNGSLDNLVISSDAFDDIVIKNSVGGAATGVRFDIDDASHNVVGQIFNADGIYIDGFATDIVLSVVTGTPTIFNESGIDVDFIVKGDTDANLLFVDAGLDAIGIGAPAESLYKLKVAGDLAVIGDIVFPGGNFGGIVAENNAESIFTVSSPGGPSLFVATINGTPSGASVVYNAPSSGTEGVLVPSSTGQLAKMKLYNTTRGNEALISNCNTGTNTITLTATVPANWANGDTITVASQTVSGGGFNWVDLKITGGPIDKDTLFINMVLASGTASDGMRVHPLSTFGGPKITQVLTQVGGVTNSTFCMVPISDNTFSFSWTANSTSIILREAGYIA
jgi:hypothetical protein